MLKIIDEIYNVVSLGYEFGDNRPVLILDFYVIGLDE